MNSDLVLRAMALAERAHRGHERKAPEDEYRPAYFLRLAEVGWMLQEAGMNDEVVAAGFLHDVMEDCDYSWPQLACEMENDRVADLVQWVSEPEKGRAWEERNLSYRQRMAEAPAEALAISCADKISNLRALLGLMAKGHSVDSFLSRGYGAQLEKFEALNEIFHGRVPERLYKRFSEALWKLKRQEIMRG